MPPAAPPLQCKGHQQVSRGLRTPRQQQGPAHGPWNSWLGSSLAVTKAVSAIISRALRVFLRAVSAARAKDTTTRADVRHAPPGNGGRWELCLPTCLGLDILDRRLAPAPGCKDRPLLGHEVIQREVGHLAWAANRQLGRQGHLHRRSGSRRPATHPVRHRKGPRVRPQAGEERAPAAIELPLEGLNLPVHAPGGAEAAAGARGCTAVLLGLLQLGLCWEADTDAVSKHGARGGGYARRQRGSPRRCNSSIVLRSRSMVAGSMVLR